MNNQIENAINEFKKVLGSNYVVTGDALTPYINNVSGTQRSVIAVLLPSKVEEVQQIVKIANLYKIPLYPISRGKNWGLGSRLPVVDHCVIVELSRMNRILEVNEKFGYAVIEAGVTQRQLYEYITEKNLPLVMDVTGSGSESSIIGNALERGVGYFFDRGEEISALTVVMPDGNLLKTGFGNFENAKAKYLYKYGIGPYLDGLFMQGNFGIVISACINLMHKQEANETFIAKLRKENDLGKFIDRIRELKITGMLKSIVHIGNRERAKISLTPLIYEELKNREQNKNDSELRKRAEELFHKEFYGSWSATGRLFGTKGFVKEAKSQIRKRLSEVADIMFITESKISLLEKVGKLFSFIPSIRDKSTVLAASKMVYKFTTGIPTDDAVKSVYWPFMNPPEKLDPDNSPCGIIFYLPITPLDGTDVESVASLTDSVMRENGFAPSITFNTINEKILETVISIPFSRGKDETEKAHNAIKKLNSKLMAIGIYPYRLSIELMGELIKEEDKYWNYIKDLKDSLDKNRIISPRRYNII